MPLRNKNEDNVWSNLIFRYKAIKHKKHKVLYKIFFI